MSRMTRPLARLAALAGALTLSACFGGDEPLVKAGDAVTPLAEGARFTGSIDCDGPMGKMFCSDGKSSKAMTVHLKNGSYSFQDDTPDTSASGPMGDQPFILGKVGEDLYVMQTTPSAKSGNMMPFKYIYMFMRIRGGALEMYNFSCERFGDSRYVKTGDLAKVSDMSGMGVMAICQPSTLVGLGRVFSDRLSLGATPLMTFKPRAPAR